MCESAKGFLENRISVGYVGNFFSALVFHLVTYLVIQSRQFEDDTVFFSSDTAGAVGQLAGPVEQAQVILEVEGVEVALLRVFAECL